MDVRVAGVPARAIAAMVERERQRFVAANPTSGKLAEEARRHWFSGVPMHWMLDWGTPFPLFVARASGATEPLPQYNAAAAGSLAGMRPGVGRRNGIPAFARHAPR